MGRGRPDEPAAEKAVRTREPGSGLEKLPHFSLLGLTGSCSGLPLFFWFLDFWRLGAARQSRLL